MMAEVLSDPQKAHLSPFSHQVYYSLIFAATNGGSGHITAFNLGTQRQLEIQNAQLAMQNQMLMNQSRSHDPNIPDTTVITIPMKHPMKQNILITIVHII
jgi:hypothetical protein